MNGLLLADSLMKQCSITAWQLLIKNYHLSELNVRSFPGKTTDQLIGGNGEIHALMFSWWLELMILIVMRMTAM